MRVWTGISSLFSFYDSRSQDSVKTAEARCLRPRISNDGRLPCTYVHGPSKLYFVRQLVDNHH
ncbi:hypothetical protein PAXRUDRAFT_824698 [Paxillus rubicundulus Ve08.2h10]|uniref:Unplaced genomic scaffold scaffold_104, whole genome shotgun sequence n=1 Tax=Paxillus rubicundulus Ve08.2h10 TaxID=930991 RepID=A0A0D0E7E4_9AGAM|nr:hypothetical protein PAXRUDRAFT_824698 [Paxillus rubicundulus Ve08.2h10]